MGMIDPNIKKLSGTRQGFAVFTVCGVADALLITGQALGLAIALANLWRGALVSEAAPYVVLFAACYALRHVLSLGRDAYADRLSARIAEDLRRQLSGHLFEAGPALVQKHGTGSVVTTLAEGIDQIQTYIGIILPKMADLLAIPTVLSLALLGIDWISGVIAIVILPAIIAYMQLLGANAKAAAKKQQGKYKRLSNHFIDTLRGLPTLKAFGRSKGYADEVYKTSEDFREATVKTLKTATLSSLILDLFRTFGLAAVAIMLGFRLLVSQVDLMPALAALIIVPEYFAAVRRYSTDFHASLDGKNQLANVLEMLDFPTISSSECAGQIARWDENSKLELSGVSFTYASQDEEHEALRDINLTATGFAKIGLIGASGSGKTTLARMLAGFSSPSAGAITANGVQVASLARPDWLSQVTYIPQEPHLFSASLKDNIAFYCPTASDDEIHEAVWACGLEETVRTLPNGLDTVIGEGGRALSGGQAQRVALARAFLDKDRKIIILDEPTAHLDIETELALKQCMLPLLENHLVIMATHRMHWVRDLDYLVVLENGRIVEAGTPDELLSHDGPARRAAFQLAGGDVA